MARVDDSTCRRLALADVALGVAVGNSEGGSIVNEDDADEDSDRIPFDFRIRDAVTGEIRRMTIAEADAAYGVPDKVPGFEYEIVFDDGKEK